MRRSPSRFSAPLFLLSLIAAFTAACDEKKTNNWVCENSELTGCAPDFALPDENPASASYNRLVSPEDYAGNVSAWYFGDAF